MFHTIQFLLFASLPFIPIADSLPKFDAAAECRSEGGTAAIQQRCAADEAQARDQLSPVWSQSSTAERSSCTQETRMDGTPSYVELLTCLEMDRDVRKMHE